MRVIRTRSGNNGGNKIKLRIGIGSNWEREERQRIKVKRNTFNQDKTRSRKEIRN